MPNDLMTIQGQSTPTAEAQIPRDIIQDNPALTRRALGQDPLSFADQPYKGTANVPEGYTNADAQQVLTAALASKPAGQAPEKTEYEKMQERVATKSPEQVQAENQTLIDKNIAVLNKELEKGDVVKSPSGSLEGVKKPSDGSIDIGMTGTQYFAVNGAIDKIPGISTDRRHSLKQATLRIRRGKATESDIYMLQQLEGETTYGKMLSSGGKDYQIAKNVGGSAAASAINNLINQPINDISSDIKAGVASGNFKDAADLYEFVGSKTKLPPQAVVGKMLNDELRKYYAETGAKSFDVENPNYPMLSAQLKINQNEKAKTEIEKQKEIEDYKLKLSKEKSEFDFNLRVREDTRRYAETAGISTEDVTAYKAWLTKKGISKPDPAYAALFNKEKGDGKVALATGESGEILTAPNADPKSVFAKTGESSRFSKELVDKTISDYTKGVPIGDTELEDYRAGLYAAIAKAIPSLSADDAETLIGKQMDNAVKEWGDLKDANTESILSGEVSIDKAKGITASSLSDPNILNVISSGGDGGIFVTRQTFIEGLAQSAGWSDDLTKEMLDDSPPKTNDLSTFKREIINAYENQKLKTAEKLAKERDTSRNGALLYFPQSKAIDQRTNEPVDMSNVSTVLGDKDGKKFYPVVKVPATRQGEELSKLMTEQLPEGLKGVVSDAMNDPRNYSQVAIEFGNEITQGRVYDGEKIARAIFGTGNNDGIMNRSSVQVSTLNLFPKGLQHLAYQVNDQVFSAIENPETEIRLLIRPEEFRAGGKYETLNSDINEILEKSVSAQSENDKTLGRAATMDNVKADLVSKLSAWWGDPDNRAWKKDEIERDLDNNVFGGASGESIKALLESGTVAGVKAGYAAVLTSFVSRAKEDALLPGKEVIKKMESFDKEIYKRGLAEYSQYGQADEFMSLTPMQQREVSVRTAGSYEDALLEANSAVDACLTEMKRLEDLKRRLKKGGLAESKLINESYDYFAKTESQMRHLGNSIISASRNNFPLMIDIKKRKTLEM